MCDDKWNSNTNKTVKPLARTVGNMKNTTTDIRGFADSLDHLLNAVEEFYPFIDKLTKKTDDISRQFQNTVPNHLSRKRKR